jgi:hypothetical protein
MTSNINGSMSATARHHSPPPVVRLLIGILLLLCLLGTLVISVSPVPLPCVTRFVSDPFNAPTYYLTYRIADSGLGGQSYLVELGQSRPLSQGGFISNPLIAQHIPLAHARRC